MMTLATVFLVIRYRTTASICFVLIIILFGLKPSLSLSSVSPPISRRLVSTSECSICPNPNSSITLPNATFPIFGTCADLEASIAFIPPDSDTCRLIQSVSSLCGCPLTDESCFLCNDNYNGPIDSSRPVPYLLDVPGVNVTCDIVQAYLHSIATESTTCILTQGLVGPYCGCPSQSASVSPNSGNNKKGCSLCVSGQASTRRNRTIATGLDLPFLRTCGDLEDVALTYWQDGTDTCRAVQSLGTYCGCPVTTETSKTTPCTFCSDGNAVPWSSKPFPYFKDQFNLGGLEPTCGLMDAAIQSISSTDSICSSVRLLGSYCGCRALPQHCTYCPLPTDRMTVPDRVVKEFSQVSGFSDFTCMDIWWTQFQLPRGTPSCWMIAGRSYVCGCNNGQFDYLGTDTIQKKRALVWIPRFSAFLSLLGSLFIMVDVYRNHRSPLDQYHELVASLSFFDFFGSMATMLTTLPIPATDKYGLPTGIYGAKGNYATCKAQGFFIQLGYTGIFYNFALAVFYVLVVNYNYRDRELKRIRKYFHIPAVMGISLAFAGIPYYDNYIWVCQIPSKPIAPSYRYVFVFILFPVLFAVVGSGIAICMVYMKVRKLSQAARRWRFSQRLGRGGGTGGKVARQVFWQAFFFVLALYATWPLSVIAEFSSTPVIVQIYEYHWVWVLTLAIAPLQGFFNCFVYMRRKIVRTWKQYRRRREPPRPAPARHASWARRAMRMSFQPQIDYGSSSSSSSSSSPSSCKNKESEHEEHDVVELDDSESTPDMDNSPIAPRVNYTVDETGNAGPMLDDSDSTVTAKDSRLRSQPALDNDDIEQTETSGTTTTTATMTDENDTIRHPKNGLPPPMLGRSSTY